MNPVTQTPQEARARGAFYAPEELARFLARWAIRGVDDRVLERAVTEHSLWQSPSGSPRSA